MTRWWLSIAALLLITPGNSIALAETPDPYALAKLGFEAYEGGDYAVAAREFEAALAAKPDLPLVWAQLGYAYRKTHRNDEAAHAFRRALQHGITDHRYGYRREVQTLENRIDATAYVIYRDSALSTAFLSLTGPSVNQSQAGVELAWTPPRIGFRDGALLQVYGRTAWGHDGDGFNVREETFQGGVGVRYRPLRSHNLLFAVERLIAMGDDARDNWMVRSSYSWDKGFDLRPDDKRWTYATLYLDAALIDPSDPDVLLTAEGRYGMSWIVGGSGLGATWTATPHMVAAVFRQRDDFHTTTLLEAGPGLGVKLYFADAPDSAHAGALDLLLQYRFKVAGDSLGGSSAVATLVFRY